MDTIKQILHGYIMDVDTPDLLECKSELSTKTSQEACILKSVIEVELSERLGYEYNGKS